MNVSIRKTTLSPLLLLACAASFLTACESPTEKAESLISEYVVAEALGARAAQKDHLVAEDREILTEQLAEDRSVLDSRRVVKLTRRSLGDLFDVKVESVEQDGGTMTVTAEVTRPKPQVLRDTLVGETMDAAKKNEDASESEVEAATIDRIREVFEKKEFPTETATEEYRLQKEGGEWRVERNLKERQVLESKIDEARKLSIEGKYEEALGRAETLEERIEASEFQSLRSDLDQLRVSIFSGQARELVEQESYEEAIAKYEKIIELDPAGPFAPMDAEQARQKLEAAREMLKQEASPEADTGVESDGSASEREE